MKITLKNLNKRYNYDWIFRDMNFVFEAGKSYAITGSNGSGKSTLLKILSGQLTPSGGEIIFGDTIPIPIDTVYTNISFAAPYIDMIDEFTFSEYLDFHFSFKKTAGGLSKEQIVELSGLQKHKHKSLKTYSSGMKQRVKLTAAILSDTTILLLDEPSSNLDKVGVSWYLDLMSQNMANRVVIIGSNMEREYSFCDISLKMEDFKG